MSGFSFTPTLAGGLAGALDSLSSDTVADIGDAFDAALDALGGHSSEITIEESIVSEAVESGITEGAAYTMGHNLDLT